MGAARRDAALVESECRPWYLDGPNGVDWIFPNSISEKREHDLYVDYVRDVTDAAGACHWVAPAPPIRVLSHYQAPDSVTLVRFLFGAGAFSTGGLAEIADIWSGFAPVPDTDRVELRRLIFETMTPSLDEVYQIGLGNYWLPGLDRWESKPASFSAGQWYLADRV